MYEVESRMKYIATLKEPVDQSTCIKEAYIENEALKILNDPDLAGVFDEEELMQIQI